MECGKRSLTTNRKSGGRDAIAVVGCICPERREGVQTCLYTWLKCFCCLGSPDCCVMYIAALHEVLWWLQRLDSMGENTACGHVLNMRNRRLYHLARGSSGLASRHLAYQKMRELVKTTNLRSFRPALGSRSLRLDRLGCWVVARLGLKHLLP